MPVIHRSQALYWLIGGRRLVSVAGAHGKTTSTGMIVTALQALDADPTFVNGGVIAQLGASSGTGSDDLFVIEADESDGTFLLYDTSIALITNVDPDHLDHYGTDDAFYDAFATFANRAREAVVISADDAGARAVDRAAHAPERADLRRVGCRGRARHRHPHRRPGVVHDHHGGVFGRRTAGRPGRAQRDQRGRRGRRAADARATSSSPPCAPSRDSRERSAASSCTASSAASASSTTTRTTRPRWRPPSRRLAPSSATGASSRSSSRTPTRARSRCTASSPRCSSSTPTTPSMLDVYGAREDPVPGVTGELVSGAFEDPAHVHYVADWQEAADYTATVAREGDYVITLGCGNVYQIIPQVLEALAHTERHADGLRREPVDGTGSSPGCAGRRRCLRRRRSRRRPGRRSADPGRRTSTRLRTARPMPYPAPTRRRRASRSRPSSRSPRRRRCSGPQGFPRTHGARAARRRAEDAAPVRLRDVWRAARARRKALRAEVRRFTGAPAAPARDVARGRGIRRPSGARDTRRRLQPAVRRGARSRVVGAVAARHRRRRGGTGGPARHAAAARRRERGQGRARRRSRWSSRTRSRRARRTSSWCASSSALPIGLIQTRAGYTLVDAAGVALSTTATPAPGRPVLTVKGGTDSPAFEAVGQVMRSLPAVDPRAGDRGRRPRRPTT